MAKAENQKQKLLYIADYLRNHTDETHAVSTPQIIQHLEENGIRAERKSIYSDIDTLIDYGYDILKENGPKGGYRLLSREFELAEVKLLVDLVQSSKFITTKKSRSLIAKLEKLVSKNDAHRLQRQVVVTDRNKTPNENIYYNVDVIYEAIAVNAQIQFQYFDWNLKKEMELRKNGTMYHVSPWLLNWDYENYYLIAYDSTSQMMKHFRVDKMTALSVSNAKREGQELFDTIDVASYSKKNFGMFSGEEKSVRLLCDNSMIGVMIDRFGNDISIRPSDDSHFIARIQVAVSPLFFAWLTGFSDKIKILSPEDVEKGYTAHLKKILDNY